MIVTEREAAIAELKTLQGSDGDVEGAHVIADAVLCALLITLGYQDVVDEWERVEKWYA